MDYVVIYWNYSYCPFNTILLCPNTSLKLQLQKNKLQPLQRKILICNPKILYKNANYQISEIGTINVWRIINLEEFISISNVRTLKFFLHGHGSRYYSGIKIIRESAKMEIDSQLRFSVKVLGKNAQIRIFVQNLILRKQGAILPGKISRKLLLRGNLCLYR